MPSIFNFAAGISNARMCRSKVDIGFIIDGSGSVGVQNWKRELQFITQMTRFFNLGPGTARAAVVTFSDPRYTKLQIKLSNFKDPVAFWAAVNKLDYYGYRTRIDIALDIAYKDMFSKENGARRGVPKLLFLVTDGKQNPKYDSGRKIRLKEHVSPLHDSGVTVVAIGVGSKVGKDELEEIAGPTENIYNVKDFKQLSSPEFASKLSGRFCQYTREYLF